MTFRRGLGLVLLATAPLLAQAATPAKTLRDAYRQS